MQLLRHLLESALIEGTLVVIDVSGRRYAFGSGEGPALTIRLSSRWLAWQLALDPLNQAAQAYIDGRLTIEDGDIGTALELLARNLGGFGRTLPLHWPSRRGVLHLELDGALFTALLGPLHWYHAGRHGLARAVAIDPDLAAIERLIQLADLSAGQRVIVAAPDSGALALSVLAAAPVEVTALMSSRRGAEALQTAALEQGLAARLKIEADLPDSPVSCDRAILVGRLEEAGRGGVAGLARRLARVLKPRGHAVLQGIVRQGPNQRLPKFADRFRPGWQPPPLADTINAMARAGLWLHRLESLDRDSQMTVGAWLTDLERQSEAIGHMYSDAFLKNWHVALGSLFLGLTAGRLGAVEMIVAPRREGNT